MFNEDEAPLPKTAEQIAQTEKEEQAGASLAGAEGAEQAGIAMSIVEPEQPKPEVEQTVDGGAVTEKEEEIEMEDGDAEASGGVKRSLDEATGESEESKTEQGERSHLAQVDFPWSQVS